MAKLTLFLGAAGTIYDNPNESKDALDIISEIQLEGTIVPGTLREQKKALSLGGAAITAINIQDAPYLVGTGLGVVADTAAFATALSDAIAAGKNLNCGNAQFALNAFMSPNLTGGKKLKIFGDGAKIDASAIAPNQSGVFYITGDASSEFEAFGLEVVGPRTTMNDARNDLSAFALVTSGRVKIYNNKVRGFPFAGVNAAGGSPTAGYLGVWGNDFDLNGHGGVFVGAYKRSVVWDNDIDRSGKTSDGNAFGYGVTINSGWAGQEAEFALVTGNRIYRSLRNGLDGHNGFNIIFQNNFVKGWGQCGVYAVNEGVTNTNISKLAREFKVRGNTFVGDAAFLTANSLSNPLCVAWLGSYTDTGSTPPTNGEGATTWAFDGNTAEAVTVTAAVIIAAQARDNKTRLVGVDGFACKNVIAPQLVACSPTLYGAAQPAGFARMNLKNIDFQGDLTSRLWDLRNVDVGTLQNVNLTLSGTVRTGTITEPAKWAFADVWLNGRRIALETSVARYVSGGIVGGLNDQNPTGADFLKGVTIGGAAATVDLLQVDMSSNTWTGDGLSVAVEVDMKSTTSSGFERYRGVILAGDNSGTFGFGTVALVGVPASELPGVSGTTTPPTLAWVGTGGIRTLQFTTAGTFRAFTIKGTVTAWRTDFTIL